jgi:O-methyltransferase
MLMYSVSVDSGDLSIGYEAWARPGLGLTEMRARLEVSDEAQRLRNCDPQWQSFLAIWEAVGKLSLLGAAKAYMVYRLAQRALTLTGDFVECGVYRGGTCLMLGLLLEQARLEKQVFMCDTFAGLPKPDRRFDKAYVEGAMACGPDAVFEAVRSMGLSSRCTLRPGLFSDTFRLFSKEQSFALVHIDCDLYQGTKESLEFLYPRLSDGAPLILDDYYDESHGVMLAVNEFAERHELVIHLSAWGQAFVIKGERVDSLETLTIGSHLVHLIADAICEEPVFLAYLEEIVRAQEDKTRRLRGFLRFCRMDSNTPGS